MAIVYHHGSEGKRPEVIAVHTIFCCPAASGEDSPREWFVLGGDRPVPKNFTIEFRYGESEEIPDNLARYLIENGLAQAEEWREPRFERWRR